MFSYLSLQQSVRQLRVMEKKLSGLLGILLDKPLHLSHQLVHLLRWKAGHCFCDVLRGILWCYRCSMQRGLQGEGEVDYVMAKKKWSAVCDPPNEKSCMKPWRWSLNTKTSFTVGLQLPLRTTYLYWYYRSCRSSHSLYIHP